MNLNNIKKLKMTQNKANYITKETKKKFDKFIQDSINKFFFVDPWDELYNITQSDHYQIISDQSTIPDLIIYNKQFNKNICFLYSNQKNYVKFPRKQFILRAVPTLEYNPSCTFPNQIKENLENNDDNKIKKNEEIKEDFVFKSIPKELEIKFNTNSKTQTKNDILDELKEFMDNKNDNKNDDKNDDKNDNNANNINNMNDNQNINSINNTNNTTNNNQYMINNNQFNNNLGMGNNMINFGGKDFEKMRQKVIYDQKQAMLKYQQFLYYKQLNNYYLQQQNNNNSLQPNKFNQFTQMNPVNQNILYNYNLQNKQVNQNSQNYVNNQNTQNNNIDLTNYYKTGNKIENKKLISDLNEIVNKNKNGKNWLVKTKDTDQEKLSCNSQELYYFLHNALNNNESLDTYKVIDKEFDMFCEPTIIYEALKSVYQKEKENNKEDEK